MKTVAYKAFFEQLKERVARYDREYKAADELSEPLRSWQRELITEALTSFIEGAELGALWGFDLGALNEIAKIMEDHGFVKDKSVTGVIVD